MTVNAAAVFVLTRTDMSTIIEAANTGDTSLIRMTNGATPTDSERHLIMNATPGDFRAASDVIRLGAEADLDAAKAHEQVLVLLQKYDTGDPAATVADVWDRMTREDREKFLACEQAIHLADEIGGAP